ncbi:MAG: 6-phosphofructokinase [Peptococcaceae bacterium]|jgi:6-phosphofructokinase 1|nr:6-phosphofructokinase [Peptococcaceae bacterium]
MQKIFKVGVLTSGGDAPGMNAAIRAVVRKGIFNRLRVFGINHGYQGLIHKDIREMQVGSVADIIHRGGTILRTARSEEMRTPEGQRLAAETLLEYEIDALVVIGGDGSFKGAQTLSAQGIKVIGIPGTIDNDIPGTELTIGFDTAVNTVVDVISKIRDTATSHERTFIVEVMGRDCGSIALRAGLASGAESILVPELEQSLDDVVLKLKKGFARGKNHSIIIVSEGVGSGYQIGEEIYKKSGFDTKVTVLGHLQRGGSPSALDAVIASAMGGKAIDLLLAGKSNMMTAYVNQKVVGVPMEVAYGEKKGLDMDLYNLAGELSI